MKVRSQGFLTLDSDRLHSTNAALIKQFKIPLYVPLCVHFYVYISLPIIACVRIIAKLKTQVYNRLADLCTYVDFFLQYRFEFENLYSTHNPLPRFTGNSTSSIFSVAQLY